jgi:imidazolonepropionase-like amidohydrolase
LTVLQVRGEDYRVQFRHLSKLIGQARDKNGKKRACRKKPSLFRAPMDVLTTCVVVHKKGVAIGHAMCWPGDNFRKDFARDTSFARAVTDCALFQEVKAELTAAYEQAKSRSTPIKLRHSAREKILIAAFLRDFADSPEVNDEARVSILAASESIRTIGAENRVRLSDSEREVRRGAGLPIRLLRETANGRAQVNAEKRARRTDAARETLPKAAS